MNKFLIPGGKIFHLSKRIAQEKQCSNNCCKEEILGKFAVDFRAILKFSQSKFLKKFSCKI